MVHSNPLRVATRSFVNEAQFLKDSRKFRKSAEQKIRRIRQQFTSIHPVFCYPGWILAKLPRKDRKTLLRNEHRRHHFAHLNNAYRLISTNGLECRLTPTLGGLQIRWLYHLPSALSMAGNDSPRLAVMCEGDILAEPIAIDAEKLVPWETLFAKKDPSGHEQIEWVSAIEHARSKNDDPEPVVLPLDMSRGARIDTPWFSLKITMLEGVELWLLSPDADDGISFLHVAFSSSLSRVKNSLVERAASRLEALLGTLTPRQRIAIDLANTIATLSQVLVQAGDFLSKTLPSLNRKKSKT